MNRGSTTVASFSLARDGREACLPLPNALKHHPPYIFRTSQLKKKQNSIDRPPGGRALLGFGRGSPVDAGSPSLTQAMAGERGRGHCAWPLPAVAAAFLARRIRFGRNRGNWVFLKGSPYLGLNTDSTLNRW